MKRKQKPLTVCIIIPVYNEENYLRACLDSIAGQTLTPDEVIVVDNNSTDDSMKIAAEYSFVRIVRESKQHQAYAQAKGFGLASSEIIGRIDADSILPVDWVANVKKHFISHPQTVAVTGSGTPYDMFLARASKRGFDRFFATSRKLAGCNLMWGANCAFRRATWLQARQSVALRTDIWEDYDLSFCLSKFGRIDLLDNIDISASFRATHASLPKQIKYQFRAIRTFALHKGIIFSGLVLLLWLPLILTYPVLVADRYVLQPIFGMNGAWPVLKQYLASPRQP